jgi:hypothetical protein
MRMTSHGWHIPLRENGTRTRVGWDTMVLGTPTVQPGRWSYSDSSTMKGDPEICFTDGGSERWSCSSVEVSDSVLTIVTPRGAQTYRRARTE